MMNYFFKFGSRFLFLLSFFAISTIYCNVSFGIKFDESLTMGMNYTHTSSSSLGQGQVSIGAYYKDIPGLLDGLGHMQVEISARHTNPAIDTVAQLACSPLNGMLDHNPALIKKLEELDTKQKQRIADLRKIIENIPDEICALDQKQKQERFHAALALQKMFEEKRT